MAFCTNCGKELVEEVKFCPYCGAEAAAAAAPAEVVADPEDIADTKVISILAYIGILVLVTIFAAPKKSVFARYHANQGLTLLIFSGICSITGLIIGALGNLSVVLAILLAPINLALSAAVIFLTVIGIINVARGRMKALPVIGKYTLLKG